jgi:hypothetical protein
MTKKARPTRSPASAPRHREHQPHRRPVDEWRYLGRVLRETLNHNDVISHLPEGTWVAGGCRTLMEALRPVFPEATPVMIIGDRGIVEHVALDVGPGVIDGDGFSTAREMERRWTRVERVPGARLIPYDERQLSPLFDQAPVDRVLWLRRELLRRITGLDR